MSFHVGELCRRRAAIACLVMAQWRAAGKPSPAAPIEVSPLDFEARGTGTNDVKVHQLHRVRGAKLP